MKPGWLVGALAAVAAACGGGDEPAAAATTTTTTLDPTVGLGGSVVGVVNVGIRPRALELDPDGFPWVTMFGSAVVVKLDPATGDSLASYPGKVASAEPVTEGGRGSDTNEAPPPRLRFAQAVLPQEDIEFLFSWGEVAAMYREAWASKTSGGSKTTTGSTGPCWELPGAAGI